MSEVKTQETPKEDQELSELLDSALKDFITNDEEKETIEEKPEKLSENTEEIDLGTEEWNEEFIKQAALQFDEHFMKIIGAGEGDSSNISEEQIKLGIERMTAAAQELLTPNGAEPQADFAATINQAIHDLSKGTYANSTGAVGDGDPNAFLPPFMQGMMQSLLSKEVLYPSLKDVLDRFPEWLDSNRDKITVEDAARYENQQKLMKEVCSVLEKEQDSDTKEAKTQRFEEVLILMQKLQEYGQPPTDLVGDVGPTPDMNNCSVM